MKLQSPTDLPATEKQPFGKSGTARRQIGMSLAEESVGAGRGEPESGQGGKMQASESGSERSGQKERHSWLTESRECLSSLQSEAIA